MHEGETHVAVVDRTPPVIRAITPDTAVLWPANHKMVPITVSTTVSDAVDPNPQVTCSATSNQAVNGSGDGNTNPDIAWSGDKLSLRAERSGNAGDRIYTISCTAKNIGGKTTTKTATVTVPHDQR